MMRLADFCYRRRRLVLAGWLVALVAIIALGGALPAEHRANYQTPGAESTKAYDVLGKHFAARQGDSIKLVFKGDIDDPDVQQSITQVIEKAAARPHVSSVDSPYDPGGAFRISADRTIAYAEVHFDDTFDQLVNDDAHFEQNFLDAIDPGQHGDLDVEVSTFVGDVSLGQEFIGLIFA